MMTNQYFKLGLVALTACTLASCVDDRYDLDDVDMTVSTSGDLTLPQSSTGDILLKSFLEETEDGVVKVVNGEFYLVDDGNAHVPDIDISSVTITKPELTEFEAPVAKDQGTSVSGRTYRYTIPNDNDAYCMIFNDPLGGVPKDIVSLQELNFVDNTKIDMKLALAFGGQYAFIDRVHLDDISLAIPKGMFVKEAVLRYRTPDGKTATAPVRSIDNANAIVRFANNAQAAVLGARNDVHIILTLEKAVMGRGVDLTFHYARHEVAVNGRFVLGGTFRIESGEFNTDKLTQSQKNTLNANGGNYDAICPSRMQLKGSAEFNNSIGATSFVGTVKTNVDKIAPIDMSDLPDFLNEPEVNLILKTPVFYVAVKNEMPVEARTNVILTSLYDDGTKPVQRRSDEIVLPANSECVLCVAEHFDGLLMPEDELYQGKPVQNVRIDDLGSLLAKLPKTVDVQVSDLIMDAKAGAPISLPQEGNTDIYHITFDYMVYTPLELGEGTRLVYRGVEEGLSGDLEDVNKMSTKAIEIAAVVETNFPMSLALSVDAQDINGKSLVGDDNIVTVDDVIINAHKGTEEFSSQDIRLTIKPTEGHTMRELLESMDKFVYRAVAEGDGKLMENAYVKLTNIRITLKGGVSYDAN